MYKISKHYKINSFKVNIDKIVQNMVDRIESYLYKDFDKQKFIKYLAELEGK